MMSLFSSFDLYFNMFPVLSFFLLIMMILEKFYNLTILSFLLKKMSKLNTFFLSLKPKMYSKISLVFTLGFMMSILILNFCSVFPFIFPMTSQFGAILSISLMIWSSFIFFSMTYNMKSFLSHSIPEGSPIYLSFLLFMIELVSNMIRPITLSVRLVANILAGHLLMILLSKLIFSSFILFPIYMGLNVVELFVAIIQSYIFCTMISLYFSEIH